MRHQAICAAVTLLMTATALEAQDRFSFDVRAVVAAPTSKLAGTELDIGLGFGGTLAFRMQPHLHLYGGWDWQQFPAEQSFAGAKVDFEETGYTLGLRFEHPFRETSGLAYRLEGGVTYKHIEAENEGGDLLTDSDHGAGFEAGAGLLTPLGKSFSLATTLRYRTLNRDFVVGSATSSGTLQYVGLEIGVTRRF